MSATQPASLPLNILVIGKDPEILTVVLRLLNDYKQANYHAIGTTDPHQARALFADSDIDLVLITNGIDPTLDASLREEFLSRRPDVSILQHFGGGSGLLFAEIAQALATQS
jgi:DNA-binding response OmpR family regulator